MESNTTTSLRATITRDTILRPGAPSCIPLLFQATSQIEGICKELQRLIIDLDIDCDTLQPCAVALALTARVKALNSVLMSYTDGDDITLAMAFREVYGTEVGERQWDAIKAAAAVPSVESDFMEGFGLAVDIFKMGAALSGPEQDACELTAKIRGKGVQQNNFALGFVQQLIDCPQLAEGFAAVLSNISAAPLVEPDELACLTYAQIAGLNTAPRAKPATKARRVDAVAV
ncbi:MAG: hypothetical protein V4639_03390 [Pseudomonadota bacterium]